MADNFSDIFNDSESKREDFIKIKGKPGKV